MATHSSILGLGNPMDRGIWWATVRETAKTRTRLSNFHFTSEHLPEAMPTLVSSKGVQSWGIGNLEHHGTRGALARKIPVSLSAKLTEQDTSGENSLSLK